MLLENNLKKYKEAPESIKQIVGLAGLTAMIIFTFIILNIFFGEIKDITETNKTTEVDNTIVSSLPKGKLTFYESGDGYQLSPIEYEAVCKNTKIVTQRSIMGANIVNNSATQLYFDNGNKIDKYSVEWDSTLNKCFAGYTIRAIEGVSDTITVSGEAKGFFKTSLDTRVYFIKNY
jgi:hypothetical protein